MTYVNRDFYVKPKYGIGRWEQTRRARARARRRRFVGTVGAGALLVFVAIACAAQGIGRLQGAGGLTAREAHSYYEVVVQPGDTLWAIAIEYGDQSRDPRAVVDELRRINELRSSVLRVGDVLQVPAGKRIAEVR